MKKCIFTFSVHSFNREDVEALSYEMCEKLLAHDKYNDVHKYSVDKIERMLNDDLFDTETWCRVFISEEDNKTPNARVIYVDWDTDDDDCIEYDDEEEDNCFGKEPIKPYVLVPFETEDDDVSDYLSNRFEYCVNAWYEI